MHAYRVLLVKQGYPTREARDVAQNVDAAIRSAESRHPGYAAVAAFERYRVRPELHSMKAA